MGGNGIHTGAFGLFETSLKVGVVVCFANPGSTELPIVATLDRIPGIRVVLGPFDSENLGCVLAAFTPENAVIVNEAASTGATWSAVLASCAAPHTVLGLTGAPSNRTCPRLWALRSHARTVES